MTTVNDQDVAGHLLAALDDLLAALMMEGGIQEPPDVDDALDEALLHDSRLRDARQRLQAALQRLRDSGVGTEVILDLEAAINALAAWCLETGYRVAWMISGAGR